MKFNKLLCGLMIALIAVTAIGCGSGTETQKESNEAANVSEKVVMPEENPDLFGKVKDTIGNEVTVYKVEAPTNMGVPKEGSQKPASQEQSQNQQVPRQGIRGAGIKVTDETETFIIPVGTPIVTMQRGTNEPSSIELKEIELTEIKKDQMLRVWKKDGAVSFVQVVGGNGNMGNGQGAGGNGAGPVIPGAGGNGGGPVIIQGTGGNKQP